jgi:hypothetical protein
MVQDLKEEKGKGMAYQECVSSIRMKMAAVPTSSVLARRWRRGPRRPLPPGDGVASLPALPSDESLHDEGDAARGGRASGWLGEFFVTLSG